MSGGGLAIGGGLGGIVVLVLALLLGADPRQLLEQTHGGDPASGTQSSRPVNPEEEELKQFSATGYLRVVWIFDLQPGRLHAIGLIPAARPFRDDAFAVSPTNAIK